MSKLKNRVAIVTGGNSGIGLATVKQFLAEGAKVVFSGRRQEALDEVSKELSGDFLAVKADQSKPEDNQRLIQEAVAKYGKLDILFVNAGVAYFLPVELIEEEHYQSQVDTNLKGPVFLTKYALPHLKDGGVIIFNTSIVHQKGFEASSVYSATKGGLRAFARVLATELKSRKIRVVSVAPGPIETPIYSKIGMSEEQVQEMGKGFAESNPLGRFGTPQEIAEGVTFLASDAASYINAIELEIDGGFSQL